MGPLIFWLRRVASLFLVSECSRLLHDERQECGVCSPVLHADDVAARPANYDPHALRFLGGVDDSLTLGGQPVLLVLRRLVKGAILMPHVGRQVTQKACEKLLHEEFVDQHYIRSVG
jgi:hypothetical protein